MLLAPNGGCTSSLGGLSPAGQRRKFPSRTNLLLNRNVGGGGSLSFALLSMDLFKLLPFPTKTEKEKKKSSVLSFRVRCQRIERDSMYSPFAVMSEGPIGFFNCLVSLAVYPPELSFFGRS